MIEPFIALACLVAWCVLTAVGQRYMIVSIEQKLRNQMRISKSGSRDSTRIYCCVLRGKNRRPRHWPLSQKENEHLYSTLYVNTRPKYYKHGQEFSGDGPFHPPSRYLLFRKRSVFVNGAFFLNRFPRCGFFSDKTHAVLNCN